jgi:DNA-binding CsgD family transcriptional regulator
VQNHVPEINRLFGSLLPSLGPDDPVVGSRHISAEYRAASPYYRECVIPYGVVDHLQYHVIMTPTRFSPLAFSRHERVGLITEREIELGGLLLPHVRRAVTISNVLDVRAIERERMTETLDAFRCGVILTNGSGSILHANRAAEQMLRTGATICGTGGVFGVKAPAAARELRTALRLAARNEAGIGKAGLAVRLSGSESPPLFAYVLPLNGSERRARLQSNAVAAVFIGAPDGLDAAGLIAAAYDLTQAETRVLASLLAGRSRAETAAHLRTTLATTKSHFVSIFAKTGVRRQAELIRLATQFAPPVRWPA